MSGWPLVIWLATGLLAITAADDVYVFFVPHLCDLDTKECLVWHNVPVIADTIPKNTPEAFLSQQTGLPVDDSGWKIRISPCTETICDLDNLLSCNVVPVAPSTCTPWVYTLSRISVEFDNLVIESMYPEYPVTLESTPNAVELNQPYIDHRPMLCSLLLITGRAVTVHYVNFDVATCTAQINAVLSLISPNTTSSISTTAIIFVSTDASESTIANCSGTNTSALVRFMPTVGETSINMTAVTLGPELLILTKADSMFTHPPVAFASNFYGLVTLNEVYFAGTSLQALSVVSPTAYFLNLTDELGSIGATILCADAPAAAACEDKSGHAHVIVLIVLIVLTVASVGVAIVMICHQYFSKWIESLSNQTMSFATDPTKYVEADEDEDSSRQTGADYRSSNMMPGASTIVQRNVQSRVIET